MKVGTHRDTGAVITGVDYLINKVENGLDDFKLDEMSVSPEGNGQVSIDLMGTYLSNGKPITIEGIMLDV